MVAWGGGDNVDWNVDVIRGDEADRASWVLVSAVLFFIGCPSGEAAPAAAERTPTVEQDPTAAEPAPDTIIDPPPGLTADEVLALEVGSYGMFREEAGGLVAQGEGLTGLPPREIRPRGPDDRAPVSEATRLEAQREHEAMLQRLSRRGDGSVDVSRAVAQMARERRLEEAAGLKLMAEAMRDSGNPQAEEWIQALDQPQEPTPRLDTMSLCAAALLDCAVIHMAEKGHASMADSDMAPCVDEVPTCRGDLRAPDEDTCCPGACKDRFRTLSGNEDIPLSLAFHKAIFEDPCVPGDGN